MLSIEEKLLNRIASGKMEMVDRQELMREMAGAMKDVQKASKVYFERNSEKETLIQWKCKFEIQMQHLHDDLVNEAERKLDENIQQKTIRKELDQRLVNYEKVLFEKSKELALKLKERGNAIRDPKAEFDSVWGKLVDELGDTRVHLTDDVAKDVTDYDVLVEFIKKELSGVTEDLKTSLRGAGADFSTQWA
ncbi:hypothetical protein NFI96_026618 [Prochilodus magdalenae]|nr:hypothetical protein NFI96_026618 [Prochilodus magdalenae]